MTTDQMIALATLASALALFASGRLRHDVVAMLALVCVVLLGIVEPHAAFEGFGHPAVITVAAVLVLSHGLKLSGVVDALAGAVAPFIRSQASHLAMLAAVVFVLSGFMNNVGAMALVLPVVVATAAKHDRPPALLLMPIAFASLLGGMTTLVGTPPNIIVASLRTRTGAEPFGMFDFTPVGLPIALAGLAFLVLVGWRLIPKARLRSTAAARLFEVRDYLVELRVPEGSPLAGRQLHAFAREERDHLLVIGLVRGGRALSPLVDRTLQATDLLLVRTDPEDLADLLARTGLVLQSDDAPHRLDQFEWEDVKLVEAIVRPGSELEGRDLRYFRYRLGRSAVIIAIARQGEPIRTRLAKVQLQAGDILLIQGEREEIDASLEALSLLPVAERGLRVGLPRRGLAAVLLFALAIGASVAGLVSTTVAFVSAAAAYVVLGVLQPRELYDGVDWPIVVLLGGMFAVGLALEQTGTVALIAQSVVGVAGDLPPWVLLTIVLVVTMFLSDIINNAATVLVMAPIAIEIAGRLGLAADPFLMAVAIGGSCAFLTPIGHQCNLLVMKPGGYRFGDYWRMGLPLEVLIVVVAIPMLLVIWPL